MKQIITTLFFLLSLVTLASAQHRTCGAHDLHTQLMQTDAQYIQNRNNIEVHAALYTNNPHKTRSVVNIPVVVHVLYNTALQNISDAQIQSQINVLNQDFRKLNTNAVNTPAAFAGLAADCEINFCLAQRDPNGNATTGITRTPTTVTNFTMNDAMKYTAQGGRDAWDRNSYLNIWVCKINGYLGYAQFPGGNAATDGVVISYRAMGTMGSVLAPYNLGRTATHEVGHWLNLFHIWGDDAGSCAGSDIINDTPNQGAENYGVPTFPKVSCSNGPNGDMFMNYMDYSDDIAMTMFTNDQKTRMQSLFSNGGFRAPLLNSLGCIAPATCSVPTNIGISNVTTNAATITWAASTGANSYNVSYKETSATTWSVVNTTTLSTTLSNLNPITAYEVRVQTICASGTSANSAVSTFTTSTPPPPPTCGDANNLTESNVTTTTGTITWDAVSGATSYNLHYKLSTSFVWIDVVTTSNAYSFTNLASGSDYEIEVQAVCPFGTSGYSPSYVLTTLTAIPTCDGNSYEPNNTKPYSVLMPTNTPLYSQIQTNTDNDWYKFTTTASDPKIKITLTNVPADYDLALFSATSAFRVSASQNGGTAPEQIVYNTPTGAGTYYVRVYGYNGAFNNNYCYTLNVTTSNVNLREDIASITDDKKPSLQIYPNPSNTDVALNYFANEGEEVTVNIYNTIGQKMQTITNTSLQGQNTISTNVRAYPVGMYMMEMVQNGETTVQKFTVTK